MTDASIPPPASRADVERLGAEYAGRAHVLHEELLRELRQQLSELEAALTLTVRSEIEHSVQVQRGELRLVRNALADQRSGLDQLAARIALMTGPRMQRVAVALLVAVALAAVLLVAAVLVAVTG